MGMFQTIRAALPCDGCGATREWLIQYKTGDDDRDRCYRDGDRLNADDPINGQRFAGILDRYCDACFDRWAADERRCALDELATMVELGTHVVRIGSDARPRDPVEIRALDRIAFPEIPRANVFYFLAQDANVKVDTVGDTDEPLAWRRVLDERVTSRLERLGWPGADPYRGCVVFADAAEDARVHVRPRGADDDELDG